ncbi:hypothetical protein GPECTOR_8g161 [Gonium pectorale]|uniref:Holocytochrome c-type synthase n=1 Tax=Gonium pectorale TaxID=33097 RepID=A0A150GSS9_GONPE|nr:hypothetical protein GPECTOR_8g161 [Gonium pectorale]|eukprot:KXZ52772.1 hypothetical protein GPECTOR_8g161 [Gonium pectorale]
MGNRQSSPSSPPSSPNPPAACAAASSGATAAQEPPSSCPVNPKYKNPAVYNVYGQRINDPSSPAPANPLASIQGADMLDPKNNMPLEPNQLPCPGQRKPLSTERVASNIPKGGTESTWLFPSPQMVFNALKRKGKGEDITEDDMEGFIAAHNSMNEATWQRVMFWESLHRTECESPTLLRFQGKPHDLSPLAWIRNMLGGPAPFDRHDWIVDRCGREVRYVIDFYFYDEKAGTPQAFEIVARPAVDSVDSALDRVKMNIYLKFAEWGLPCPITGHSGGVAAAATQQQPASGAGSS